MGNKNGTPSNKKQNKSLAYQEQQLRNIEREIQDQHSSTSLSSLDPHEQDGDDNIHGNNRHRSQSIIYQQDFRSSFPSQNAQQKNLSRFYQIEGNSDPLSGVPNSSQKSRNTSYQTLANSKQNITSQTCINETERKEAKKNIIILENQLSSLIRQENYFGSLEKLFEILFLNKKVYQSNSEQVAFTMHRMSSILCLLGRLEEALKYEYDSCQIRKKILGGLDVNITKSLIYISKLLWYFKKYIQSFYYILEAYNISEHPKNRHILDLKQMIGEVSLEMSNIAHENEDFILSFKLRVIAFQSKRALFLVDESYIEDDLTMLSHEVWTYKQGVFLLQMIPTRNYQLVTGNQSSNQKLQQQEDNCPICYIEFNEGDQQKQLLCSHIFHSHCIDRWIIKNQKCPMCRKFQDLEEYLNFQQKRLQKIKKDHNERILQKQKKLLSQNGCMNARLNKKIASLHQYQQQNELVQLSPRTSATFSFLQEEFKYKESDIFMKDYNQHFNLLPLPPPDFNINISMGNNNVKAQNSQTQAKNTTSVSDAKNIQSNGKQSADCKFNNLSDNPDSVNLSSNTSSATTQQSFGNNISSRKNLNLHNNHTQSRNLINQDDEDEEEQKHVCEDQEESESFYCEGKHAYYSSRQKNPKLLNKNSDISESILISQGEPSNKLIIDEPFNNLISNNGFLIRDHSQIGYGQPVNQDVRKYYFYPQYEGLMAESPYHKTDTFGFIQEFEMIFSYHDSDEEESSGSSNSNTEDFEENVDESDNCPFKNKVITIEQKPIQERSELTNQSQFNSNIDSQGQELSEECLFTEQSSTLQNQPQIRESINTKSLQNRYLYFEEDIKKENTLHNNLHDNSINKFQSSNQSSIQQHQQQQQNTFVCSSPNFKKKCLLSKKDKQCNLNCLCCNKNIDDADVNFDEEGISESNNKSLPINGQRVNDIHISHHQKSLNNNNFQSANFSINPFQHKQNPSHNLINNNNNNQLHSTETQEKIVTSNMTNFTSKITVNNTTKNNYYLNDECDIFDKKSNIKFNNQKIDLFEDDQKENKFLFENSLINNNKYSQMNFY